MPAVAPSVLAAAFAALMLAACSTGGGVLLDASEQSAPGAPLSLAGRWMLAAPNAPACGVEFRSRGGQAGDLTPDGGCPGNLYLSRRWALADGTLTITSENDDALAQLQSRGEHFEGKTADGLPLVLSRKNPH
jgi:hypothetical protein